MEQDPFLAVREQVERETEGLEIPQRIRQANNLSDAGKYKLIKEVVNSHNPEWASNALHSYVLRARNEDESKLKQLIVESKDPTLCARLLSDKSRLEDWDKIKLSVEEMHALLEIAIQARNPEVSAKLLTFPPNQGELYPWTPELRSLALETLCKSKNKDLLLTALGYGFNRSDFTDDEKGQIKRAVIELKDPHTVIKIYQGSHNLRSFTVEEKEQLKKIVIESGDSESAKRFLKYGRGLTPQEYSALASIAQQNK